MALLLEAAAGLALTDAVIAVEAKTVLASERAILDSRGAEAPLAVDVAVDPLFRRA